MPAAETAGPGAEAATASDKKPAPARNSDRVGEELAEDANIWHVYDRVAKEDDDRRTKSWDNGLNNLALFAGLFSAVTTAFIIEAQQDMEPDYAQLTFLVLNATASGERFVQRPFVVPPGARTVNCLWIASLVLSLSAALIAIMGKDWIGMYTARPVCNLRQWAEMRTYRLLCVERWYMSGVIAAAPVLLHISLLLFGAGLVVFISSDPLTHHLTLGISLAAGVLYLVTTLSAVVFSASPFKSPATQMLRSALSVVFSYLRSFVYRPKRNLVGSLLRDINLLVVGRAQDSVGLPGCEPQEPRRPARRPAVAIVSAALDGAIAYLRSLPTSVRAARSRVHWSRMRSRVRSIGLAFQRIPLSEWFLSSTWTDLPVDRRPNLVAEALSWLSGASQSPDVFRAIIFALGDLDIGPEVGPHISLALHTRLRTEIRRSWQQVDFLSLSRFVLADRNTPGHPALEYGSYAGRFNLSANPELRCEDGLAAVIKVFPTYLLPHELAEYSPDHLTQPRMLELLLPYIQQTEKYLPDALVLISSTYKAHLSRHGSFGLLNLEAHLYQSLDSAKRDAYADQVTGKYGGRTGAIELLTFLCCTRTIHPDAEKAAVELIMELLHQTYPIGAHRCLAYLFGRTELRHATRTDKGWPPGISWFISESLELCLRGASGRSGSGDPPFDLALARSAGTLLLPQHEFAYGERWCIDFLFAMICGSQPALDESGTAEVISGLIEDSALLKIVGRQFWEYYEDDGIGHGTAILATIISDLGRRLHNPATFSDGERLFGALAFTETKGPTGDALTWDLGEWLRLQAPDILKKYPSSTTGVQDIHDALSAIYPLCADNRELRVHWDRIGYPGRPGDIFTDPFLDLGAFFESAEAPRERPKDIETA